MGEEERTKRRRDVLRCKGILKCKSKNDAPPLILQGVRDVYEITDGFDGLKLQEDGLSKVVLIGRRLRLDELRVGFESCFFSFETNACCISLSLLSLLLYAL